MNSTRRLTELFQVFQELENREILKFKDELIKISKTDNKNLEQSKIIKYYADEYSKYAVLKIKEELIHSVNYSITMK